MKNTIIWAVDPKMNIEDNIKTVSTLKIWSKKHKFKILPISVISTSSLNIPIKLKHPWIERLDVAAQRALSYYLKKSNASDFLEPKVIFTKSLSQNIIENKISDYARQVNAPYIFSDVIFNNASINAKCIQWPNYKRKNKKTIQTKSKLKDHVGVFANF